MKTKIFAGAIYELKNKKRTFGKYNLCMPEMTIDKDCFAIDCWVLNRAGGRYTNTPFPIETKYIGKMVAKELREL